MLISTTQREYSRGPWRAASVLSGSPSIFKFPPNVFRFKASCKNLFENPVFQQWWIRRFLSCVESGWEPAERGWRSSWRQERRAVHAIFTYPWGIHFPGSLGIRCIKRSMAAYSEMKHNSSRRVGKQEALSEKCIFYLGVKWCKLCLALTIWVITLAVFETWTNTPAYNQGLSTVES